MKMLNKSCGALLMIALILVGLGLFSGTANAANYVVSKTADSIDGVCDSDCSLREAVYAANDDGTASTITFNPTVFAAPRKTVTTTYSVNISQDVTITAPAAGVVLQAGNSGNIITVTDSSVTANFTGLTFSGGNTSVENNGTANLTNCTLSGSTYGFINYGPTANFINCTITGSGNYGINNGSSGGSGGSGGSSSGGGGSPSALTLTNCTVTGNGTAINNAYGSVVTVKNSIVAGNSTHLSDFSDPLTDGGNNILGGTAVAAGLDPSGLQDNGGPSRTIALLSSSPAIDAANDANAPAKDQRGIARPQGARSDIGAYEAMLSIVIRDVAASEGNSGTTNFVFTVNLLRASANAVTVSYATADGTASAATDYTAKTGSITIPAGQTSATITVVGNGDTTREPDETFFVNLSNPVNAPISDGQGIGTIIADDFETPSLVVDTLSSVQSKTDGVTSLSDAVAFANSGTGGTITFNPTVFAAPRKTILVTSTLTFYKNIDITGPAAGVTIEGNTPPGFQQVDNIFQVRGDAHFDNVTVSKGVNGILNNGGNVYLTNCTLSNNGDTGFYSYYGTGSLTNCTLSGNSIGIKNSNSGINLVNCTLSGNSTFGLYNSESATTLSSCTVSGNATGISNNTLNNYKLTLKNSIVAGNTTNTAGVITYGVNNIAAGTAASAGLETDSSGQPVLKDNDGPTKTIALVPGGAAIDAAADASSPSTDQRGYARPQGTHSDIGAFELAPMVLVVTDVTANEGNSGTTNFVFNIKLLRPSTNAVTVSYATADGTATAGTDYTAQSGTLTIPAGAFIATITVAVKGDLAYEPNETFFVNLSNAVNAPIADAQGVGTINTDEFETPSLVVTSTSDVVDNTDGGNSLREAMNFANEDGVNSAITFSPTVFAAPRKTITLGGEQLPYIVENSTVSITAPLAGVVVSGNNLSGVFEIGGGAFVTFKGLTISGGTESGIRNYGNLLVDSCTLSGNSSYSGGAISTQDNYTGASLTVRNSTLSGNSASEGGAIYSSYGSTRIESSTITGNSAPDRSGAGIACDGDMFDTTSITVQNSIISGNTGTDLDYIYGNQNSANIRSEGNNLIGDGSGSLYFYEPGDVTGNTDPGLAALADNGGPTQTHALLVGSLAINAGNSNATGLPATDQRGTGFPRIRGGRVDIGAFEAESNVAPLSVSVTPASGSSSPSAAYNLTATYSDSDGVTDISQVRLLVNTSPNASNALYGWYDRAANKLYLVNNTNSAALGGFAPGSANVITNSQGSLNCAATTVSTSGNNLIVNWNFTPSASFTGTKNVYGYARDNANAVAPLIDLADWTIGNAAPLSVSVTPSVGSSNRGVAYNLTATYSDANGVTDISQVRLLVNTSPNASNALYGWYDRAANKLYLVNNTNSAALGGFAPGSANVITNSQGSLNCAATTVSTSGNNLIVNWNFTPSASFTGTKNVYGYARDNANAVAPLIDLADWTIGNAAPLSVSVTPSVGSSNRGVAYNLTATYSDANGVTDISQVRLLVNTSPNASNALYGWYDRAANKLYLVNNTNSAALGGFAPGSANVITNSQGSLNCAATTVSTSGNNLIVNWNFTPSASFTGTKNVYGYARDNANAVAPLIDLADWTISSPALRFSPNPSGGNS